MKFPHGLILYSHYGCKLFAFAILVGNILETMVSLCIKGHWGLAYQNWCAVTVTLLCGVRVPWKRCDFFFFNIIREQRESLSLQLYSCASKGSVSFLMGTIWAPLGSYREELLSYCLNLLVLWIRALKYNIYPCVPG